MVQFSNFNSLFSLVQYFSNDEVCLQTIIEHRWGEGERQDAICPYCGKHHCNRCASGRFHCTGCNSNFSCLVGTIFENTKLPLTKWFIAMYLLSSHKKGVSSRQLAKDLGVTPKTAWYMEQKIRTILVQYDTEALSGDVELDEVYIGGKEKWKHKSMRTPKTQGRSTKTKTPVFGMTMRTTEKNERDEEVPMSYVRAIVVEKTDKATLLPIIQQFVEYGSHLITDELSSYKGLTECGYTHSVVNHGTEEYVNGSVFTNNMEGFWSHFRRMIIGIYHDVSDKYLQRYVDEACYRWNVRLMKESEVFDDMLTRSIGKCKYRDVRMERTSAA